MSENQFNVGDIVEHVHPDFSKIDLHVVKVLGDGWYKCRYKIKDFFSSDDFASEELKLQSPKKTSLGSKALSH